MVGGTGRKQRPLILAERTVEVDHSQLKARLRPMRGLQRLRSAQTVAAGHAFVQNVRRGYYEIATGEASQDQLSAAFNELALAV